MKHPSLQGVIFDMDGLMIDSEPLQYAAYQRILAAYGVVLHEEDFIRWCIGRTAHENWTFLRAHFQLPVTVKELQARRSTLYLSLLTHQVQPMPGLLSLLARLREAHLRLAIASSSRRMIVDLALSTLGLAHCFTAVVTGEQVARGKPEPDIFLQAAQRLGVAPSTCVVLEDSQAGTEAASRAHMPCIAIPNRFTVGQDFSKASLVLPTLNQVTYELLATTAVLRKIRLCFPDENVRKNTGLLYL